MLTYIEGRANSGKTVFAQMRFPNARYISNLGHFNQTLQKIQDAIQQKCTEIIIDDFVFAKAAHQKIIDMILPTVYDIKWVLVGRTEQTVPDILRPYIKEYWNTKNCVPPAEGEEPMQIIWIKV